MADVREHYADDAKLRARQRLWTESRREPPFSLQPWVIELAGIKAGERVLDVGCGNGGYLSLIEEAGAHPVGADLSPGILADARRHSPAPLLAADVTRLPLADESFDVVLAPHMLYHVPDRAAAAAELRRVLRPGGVCVAVTNGDDSQLELRALVEGAVGGGWRWERQSGASFSLENGPAQLAPAFRHVERVDCPPSPLLVSDPDLVGDYIASMDDWYGGEIDGSWLELSEQCRRRAAQIIDTDGVFRITPVVGAIIARA